MLRSFEVCDDAVVARFKVSDYEPTSCEIFDEAEASTASEPTAEQVVDLCGHGRWKRFAHSKLWTLRDTIRPVILRARP